MDKVVHNITVAGKKLIRAYVIAIYTRLKIKLFVFVFLEFVLLLF